MENIHNLIQLFLGGGGSTEAEMQLATQLKSIMDWMPGGFFIYYAHGGEELIYANEAVQRMFLCSSMEELRELTGNSFRGIVHPDDLEPVEESIALQIANSQLDLDYVEYRIVRKDGSVRWVDDYGHLVSTDAGDVFCVFIGDNTEEKLMRLQREKNLQNRVDAYHQELEGISEEYLRRLEVIEGLSADYESIFYIDLDSNIIQTYQLSSHLDGSFEGKNRTQNYSDFVNEYTEKWVCQDDRERFYAFLSPQGLRDNLAQCRMCDMDYRLLKDGETEYFQLHAVSGGRPSQIILGARSVDAYIRNSIKQREVLEEALHQANSAVVAKNAFLANMSHDMRTPMNAILGFTALAKKHLHNSDRTGDYLNMIEAAGNQLLQLVNEVLEIARIEAGKMQADEKLCDLRLIASHVRDAVSPQAAEKHHSLILDIGSLSRPMVYSDAQKLEQLMVILADNAVKYTPAGGKVVLSIQELDASSPGYGSYRLSVQDNGIGISDDFIERIFVPFERQKNTTSSHIPGTGLGLSIARSIAELLGSRLCVQSRVNEGSEFFAVFTFREAEPLRPVGSAAGIGRAGEIKILLVDDNELNLEIERELLEGEGYAVDVATDGSEAVEAVRRSSPGEYAIVFMDIQMPVMDGYEATRRIRTLDNEALAGIPIVAVSANAYDEDKRKSSESGMNDHIAKPVSIEQLQEAIEIYGLR